MAVNSKEGVIAFNVLAMFFFLIIYIIINIYNSGFEDGKKSINAKPAAVIEVGPEINPQESIKIIDSVGH